MNVYGGYNSNLWYEAREGDYNRCKQLLEQGEDPNISHEFYGTPLNIAAWKNNLHLTKLFVDHGANPNIPDKFHDVPLTEAAFWHNYDVCRYLILNADVEYNTAVMEHFGDFLYYASIHGDMELSQKLVQSVPEAINMKNGDGKNCLAIALENNHHKLSNFLMEHGAKLEILEDLSVLYHLCTKSRIDLGKLGENFTDILCYCSLHGNLGLCQKLIQSNPEADVNMRNKYDETALTVAIQEGYHKVVTVLLGNGAKVTTDEEVAVLYNYCNKGLIDLRKLLGNFGNILCYASQLGDINLCQKLIQRFPGVDINDKNLGGKTALIVAAEEEQYDILEYLLSQGATWEDINVPIIENLTPLYFVCRSGNIDWVQKFVKEYKANINGDGCLSVSLEFYHHEVAEFLMNSGCDINKVTFAYFSLNSFHLLPLVSQWNYRFDDGCKNQFSEVSRTSSQEQSKSKSSKSKK